MGIVRDTEVDVHRFGGDGGLAARRRVGGQEIEGPRRGGGTGPGSASAAPGTAARTASLQSPALEQLAQPGANLRWRFLSAVAQFADAAHEFLGRLIAREWRGGGF